VTIANPSICSRCATTYTRTPGRLYSSTASTTTTSAASEQPPTPSPGAYDIRSGLILTRPPLLTRTLHPFENAFFFYQKRLEERLNTPFITNVYFKPDTARRIDWDLKVKERQGTVAKELGVYHGKSAAAWDDELKVGDGLSSQESIVGAILKDAEARVSDDAEIIPAADVQPVEPPNERLSEADKKADVKRLDRAMDRTLYLVVKGKDGWSFPADVIPDGENLHQVSARLYLKNQILERRVLTISSTVRPKSPRPSCRGQHEHLDCWPCPCCTHSQGARP
jgi:large subunit ribosomal protein L46